jgi:hypothetical protein
LIGGTPALTPTLSHCVGEGERSCWAAPAEREKIVLRKVSVGEEKIVLGEISWERQKIVLGRVS